MSIVKIHDVAKQIRGVSYKPSDVSDTLSKDYLTILRANNITEYGIKLDDLVYVSRKCISEKQLLKKGDILIAASSGSKHIVGRAISIENDIEASFGAFCKVVRPNERIDHGYLANYFRSSSYRRTISHLSAGANINNIRNEDIDNLVIPLPPLTTQKRIAEILDKADALRKKNQQLLKHYDDLAQSLFIDMFGDPLRNEKGWNTETLGNLIFDGPQNGLYKSANDYGSGIPILRIDSFYDGVVYNVDKLKRVNATEKEVKLFQIYEGDIVINRVNSRSHLGKCALIPKLQEPTLFESNMMRLEIDKSIVNPVFLTRILIQPFMKAQILGRAKDSINQSSINQQDVKSFWAPVPPIQLQNDFAQTFQNIEQQKQKVKAQMQESEHLFQALLQQAFNGGLN
ncbi:restriction endonuclease subunit S [Mucilaginibacter aquaedulcis]|uniref:restriction endonuclease subunit S n=1 Tax=Mucilaginibacter aquaedulcis TaxID=1187081 RepID=UPI0025B4C5B8|nr:restriction endonuclease subunit S [Mucilaginibacter aquaedulcis]MDN3551268.1 restriction endonuclease subunit S [Mucilaginibacter aquaedulcis]